MIIGLGTGIGAGVGVGATGAGVRSSEEAAGCLGAAAARTAACT